MDCPTTGRGTDVDDAVELELVVEAPAGWVAINLDEDFDAQEYALAVHRFLAEDLELAGEAVDRAAVDAAAAPLAALTRWARDLVRDRGGVAFAYVGHPEDPTPVWLDVLARPEDDFTAWAEERFGVGIPAVDPRADVREVVLPAGPALRVRSVVVPQEGESPVTEGVDVLVRPDGVPGRVVLSSTWVALAHGDQLAALVDEFADTVRVRVVPPGEHRE